MALMKRSETATIYLRSGYSVLGSGGHRMLYMQGQEYPVCLESRCPCDRTPLTRLDEDRFQVCIKSEGEMWQTYVLVGWAP